MNDWTKGGLLGSIRKRVAREVKKHRRTNAALLKTSPNLAICAFHWFFGGRSLLGFFNLYFPFLILSVFTGIITSIVYPPLVLPDMGSFLKDLTSYFLGAQTVMVGLLFPIAVGLVTLIVQREGASSTIADVHVYYSESLAYGIGASGIALSIVLAFQLAWQLMTHLFGFGNAGGLSTLLITVIHLLWLIINFMGLWHFLAISLSFVRPTERAHLRRRFAANVSIPEDLFGRLFQKLYVDAGETVLSGSSNSADDKAPSIWLGSSERWGDVEIADAKLSGKFLHDVWMTPLRWALRRWSERCKKQSSSSYQRRAAPLLAFALGLGHPLPRGGILCTRKSGVPLTTFEKFMIKRCFRLRKKIQESKATKDQPGPSDMLEELADKVIGHMDRLAVTSFETALDEMVDFHRFLIDAYATTGKTGGVASYAQVGGWIAPHEEWIKQYRRLFARATDYITKENDFIYILLRVPYRLLPANGRHTAPAVTAGLLDLSRIFVHQLEAWLTRRRISEGAQNEDQPAIPRLAGSDKQAYEEFIRRFVGEWESTVRRARSIYGWSAREIRPDDEWSCYGESWTLLERHLRNTAYMLVVAVWNEDEIGADHYCEVLLRWFDAFRHQLKHDFHLFEGLLTPDLLEKKWQDAQDMVPHPEWHRPTPAGVFSTTLQDILDDAIFVVSGIMLGWFVDGRQNSDIAPRTVYRLLTDSVQDDGTHRVRRKIGFQPLMTSFLRMYAVGERFARHGYGYWLDSLVDFLDFMSETRVIPGRVFTPSTRNGREDLLVPWLSCLLTFMPPEDDANAVQAFARLTACEDAFPEGGTSLRGLLDDLKRAKQVLASDHREGFEKGSLALQPDAPVDERIGRLASIFDQIVTAIEAQREERLQIRPVDEAKLDAVRKQFEQAITTDNGGIEVFQGFSIDRDAMILREYEARLSPIEKGWLTEPVMAQEPINLWEEEIADVQRFAASLVWRDFLGRPRRVIDTQDEASFLAALRDEARKIRGAGRQPILIVRGWDDPSWIRDWFSWSGRRPPEVEITMKDDVQADNYIGTIDGFDVYNGYNLPQEALPQENKAFLFPADILKTVQYGVDPQNRIVHLKFYEGQDQESSSLVVHLSQEAQWQDDEVVVIQYPANNTGHEEEQPFPGS